VSADPKSLQAAPSGSRVRLDDFLDSVPFDANGLIAAVAQDADSRDVLMVAWMDRTAIARTLAEGYACYFSRSRQTHWRKGESSGHLQQLVALAFDCYGDAVLLTVRQAGPACHTNRPTCFYLVVENGEVRVATDPV
jgi:phosphoribosyl-AMP cyclohydrolase